MNTTTDAQKAPEEEKDMFIGQYLLDKLKNQEVFVCECDPEIDIMNPYFRAETPPVFQVSLKKNNYTLATTVRKKFFWKTWDSVKPIAEIVWIFYGGRLESLQIKSWYGEKFREKILQIREYLASLPELGRCDVLVLEY